MNGANRNQETLQLDMEVIEETPRGFRARKDPYPQGNRSTMLNFNDAFPLLLSLADGIHPTYYGARQGNEIEAYVKAITIGITSWLQTKD